MPEASKTKSSPQDYERLGQVLQDIYVSGYTDRWRMLRMNFLKGVATGLGGVIGATIMVALLLWILARFDQIPLLGPVSDVIERTIKK